MKIGLVSPEFPPERGGVQTYAWEYARELARRGHEVTVFTQSHPGGKVATDAFRIVPRLRLRRRLDREVFAEHSVDVWHVMNAAYSWLALELPRVFVTVHGNDFLWPYVPVARLDLRERLRLPFGSRLDGWLGDRLTRALVKRALPRATHIFANSRYTEQRFCEENPACRGRTSAAMVGVAEEFFDLPPLPRWPGPMRFVTVCRLAERHKNVDLVLRALAQLKDRHEFHYTIVGDGELRPEYEALTAELGLQERVTFAGFLETPEMRGHLLDSDLFILPTSATPIAYEGFGLVYLEANACGCPVLAARIGGAVEAVDGGISGMFVDEVSPVTIAHALERYLSGEVRFDPKACVAFARQFSWGRVVDHCLAQYEKSLG